MKKTLVAIAALTAVSAFAQSSVSIIGRMDAGYQSLKYFGQSASLVTQNGASTSAIKFTGTEDMGGGIKAGFMYEIDPLLISGNGNGTLNVSAAGAAGALTASSAANVALQQSNATQQPGLTGKGEQFVSLSDVNLGTVKFGTPNTATLAAFGQGSLGFGTAVGSGYGSTGIIFADLTRVESTAKYESPVFNGFSASYIVGPKNDTPYGTASSSSGQTVYTRRAAFDELGLAYVNGPLAANYAHINSKVGPNASSTAATSNNVKTTTDTLGASYDFGMAKVGYTMQNQKNDNTLSTAQVDTKAQAIAVSVPFGANRLMLKSSSRKSDAGQPNLIAKSTMTGLGLERDLSKTTFVYIRHESAKFNDVAASAVIINNQLGGASTAQITDPKRTTTMVGLSMGF